VDIQKLLEWGTTYFSEYFSVFISTLRRPVTRFEPVVSEAKQQRLYVPNKSSPASVDSSLNSKLFAFIIISIFIGSTLNSIVPGQPPVPGQPLSPDIITTSIVTAAVWFAYSVSIYGVCRLLGGKGNFWETISISLQLLAVIYVVSNFATLIWSIIAQVLLFYKVNGTIIELNDMIKLPDIFMSQPFLIYYFIQFGLMIIYLPLSLKPIHKFGFIRRVCVNVVPIVITFLMVSLFAGMFIFPPRQTPIPHYDYMPPRAVPH